MARTMAPSTSTSPRMVTSPEVKQIVQHIDVGGHAGDEPADGIAVEKGNVQPLQMLHQLPAEVEHGNLAGVLHEVRLGEFGDEHAQKGKHIEGRDLCEARPWFGGKIRLERSGLAGGVGNQVFVDCEFSK